MPIATLPNSGERSVAALPDRGRMLAFMRASCLPLEGKGDRFAVDEVHLLDRGRVLSFTSAGGAKPIAGRGGLEGFTPPHNFRRGQRLPTDIRHSPAPREAHRSGLQ